jgi:hypothetical protein
MKLQLYTTANSNYNIGVDGTVIGEMSLPPKLSFFE